MTTKQRPIRKAVFPVAGLGTRFLPATKCTPKEMLPVLDKPVIQYVVEEALDPEEVELASEDDLWLSRLVPDFN